MGKKGIRIQKPDEGLAGSPSRYVSDQKTKKLPLIFALMLLASYAASAFAFWQVFEVSRL